MIKGINIVREALVNVQGEDAVISISHKLYGSQQIKCELDYILDDERIGFKAPNGQEIFMYRVNLVDCGTSNGIYFADDIMEINIKLNRAAK